MKQLAACAAAFMVTAHAQPAPDPTDIQVPTVAQLAQLCDGCVWVQQVRVDTPKKASAVKAAASLVVGGLLGRPAPAAGAASAASANAADSATSQTADATTAVTAGPVWDVVVVDKDGVVRHVALRSDPQLRPGDVARRQGEQLLRR